MSDVLTGGAMRSCKEEVGTQVALLSAIGDGAKLLPPNELNCTAAMLLTNRFRKEADLSRVEAFMAIIHHTQVAEHEEGCQADEEILRQMASMVFI